MLIIEWYVVLGIATTQRAERLVPRLLERLDLPVERLRLEQNDTSLGTLHDVWFEAPFPYESSDPRVYVADTLLLEIANREES